MSDGGDRWVREAAARGEAVPLAQVLVSVPSVNPSLSSEGHGEAAVAEVAAAWLRDWGFRTRVDEIQPGRCNVVATLDFGGTGGPTLLLNGHVDTVGVGGMTVPPFEGVVHDGKLVGRGACDMKGGVAAALSAAAALAADPPPRGRLVLALTADEEHASLGMDALVQEGVRASAAVVCEPTGLAVMPAHKGFVWLHLHFRGRAAHGSRPEEGVDAVRHAGLYLAALDELAEELGAREPHPLLGHGSFHAGTVSGGEAPSVYPATCDLTLERRTLPGEDTEAVVREFEDVLGRLGERESAVAADLRVGLVRPGTEVPAEASLVQGLLASARSAGVEGRVEGMTAWVDAAFLNEAGIPAVCFGPGSIAQAHSADEWCDTGEIESCARILEHFARSFFP